MEEDDLSLAKSQLHCSLVEIAETISRYNTEQRNKRKEFVITSLEQADPESVLDIRFISEVLDNSSVEFPFKTVEEEVKPFVDASLQLIESVNSDSCSVDECDTDGGPSKRQRTSSLSSIEGSQRILLEDLRVSLINAGPLRCSKFQQLVNDIAFERDPNIAVISEDDVDAMIAWASSKLDVISCRSFGISYQKMTSRDYWKAVAKKGTSFSVSIDERIVGYVPCFGINSLDAHGVPASFGAVESGPVETSNLACLGYIKSVPTPEDENALKGVMKFAVEKIIEWLFFAEPRLNGCMVIIKVSYSDTCIPDEEEVHYLRKARDLAESLGMECQPKFHGSKTGDSNAFVLLRK
mmetsp:Transcript_20055/g.28819  ORF Transcript_20055/g.28819 Transcript_20055/m.28819 type:complete len:352 (-) Transcript_20055:175-1230(-)|eukprot:CAMPEP_0185020092 /NCGR_PEP_ID=MMETSP1103-20130426/2690_1 /TAXON_ID=36769 /ORGANISM="Paraphysomonas bandaiensis, Strain Caron Lab Isolate" /LENGTH=351 /DNA_ID=CAMNT_0027550787 /DNA_START=70 /DNA_END=1125 /DNA_ORIENTATION=-